VLDHLDLEVASGESVAVLGRSGSGKTTLLRVVSGLEDLDAGRVAVGGQLVSGEGAFAAPNARGIGYVFQSSALWPHLTVAQNILFGVRSRDKATRNAVVAELLERLEIPGLAGRYPDRLSGGEARRVAIARAIAPSPALLLFDEALTNLDWDLKGRLIDVLNRRVRGSAAMLFVTHDPDEAHRVSDRRLLLSEGRLGPWGSPGI
jgi:iron(III) transport system ATP-binding protein